MAIYKSSIWPREYKSWSEMRARCRNPQSISYRFYGAVGISICERWNSFDRFMEDMGPRPMGHTLDRIKSSLNYEPSNWRYGSCRTQAAEGRGE